MDTYAIYTLTNGERDRLEWAGEADSDDDAIEQLDALVEYGDARPDLAVVKARDIDLGDLDAAALRALCSAAGIGTLERDGALLLEDLLEAFVDEQDPANTGWAYRYEDAVGGQESGALDTFAELLEELANARKVGA